MSLLLAGSLFAGSRTVNRDVDNLQRWMREQHQWRCGQPPKRRESRHLAAHAACARASDAVNTASDASARRPCMAYHIGGFDAMCR